MVLDKEKGPDMTVLREGVRYYGTCMGCGATLSASPTEVWHYIPQDPMKQPDLIKFPKKGNAPCPECGRTVGFDLGTIERGILKKQ